MMHGSCFAYDYRSILKSASKIATLRRNPPMTSLYLCAYRLFFAIEDFGAALASRRMTRPMRSVIQLTNRVLRRFVLPKFQPLVRVQSGLSRGMWARVHFPEEASYWSGRHELAVQEAITDVIHQGAVVYDVGAHIGSIALGTARLVGDAGCVVAFDGDPENVVRLQESCKMNGLVNCVQVVHAAVWSHSAKDGIPFRRGARRPSHGGVEADGYSPVLGDGAVIKVPSITLDEFIASNTRVPKLVKIDVEGGEFEILRGGETLFTRYRPLIIVEIHHQGALDQIEGWLTTFRYCAKWKIPEVGFPRLLFGWPSESSEARFR
jgi:FkbM family methyltransferase